MKDKDDEKFKELLKENKVNKDFFEFVNLENVMNYKLLLSTDYFFTCRPLIFAMEDADKMVDKSFVSAWKEIYKDINSKWLQSSFHPSLMGRLRSLDKIEKENSNSNLPYAIDNINSFKSLLSGDLIEFAWGHMIYEGINNNS